MAEATIETPQTETPSAPPAPMSLREHIAAETPAAAAPAAAVVAPAAAAAVTEPSPAVTPEVEADSDKPDADLSAAGRALRMNRADKRAQRIRQENDDLARELARRRELRSEADRLATGHPTPTAGGPPAGTTTAPPQNAPSALDPSDPEPQETNYTDYAQYVRDQARWAAREELRRQQVDTRERVTREARQRDLSARADKLDAVADTMRSKYADFDAVVDPVIHALGNTPRGLDVSAFLADSEVGGEVAYRLGKDPALIKAVSQAPTRVALIRELAKVESAITAAKSAAKPVTSAPAVPSQTVGASATATELDTRKGVPLKDHIRIEEAELADRRRQGYRY